MQSGPVAWLAGWLGRWLAGQDCFHASAFCLGVFHQKDSPIIVMHRWVCHRVICFALFLVFYLLLVCCYVLLCFPKQTCMVSLTCCRLFRVSCIFCIFKEHMRSNMLFQWKHMFLMICYCFDVLLLFSCRFKDNCVFVANPNERYVLQCMFEVVNAHYVFLMFSMRQHTSSTNCAFH